MKGDGYLLVLACVSALGAIVFLILGWGKS
jgi:hypothetical protein